MNHSFSSIVYSFKEKVKVKYQFYLTIFIWIVKNKIITYIFEIFSPSIRFETKKDHVIQIYKNKMHMVFV